MSKSNTGGAGRGGNKSNLIGEHIFHGKKKYWAPGSDYFYHNLLKPGDNTLETLLMIRFSEFMSRHDNCDFTSVEIKEKLLKEYIDFLTTKDSHRDTYCGTSHRMFFQNLLFNKKDKYNCADNDRHNVDAIDALVCLTPLCIFYSDNDISIKNIDSFSALFRDSKVIPKFAKIYNNLIRDVVLKGTPLHEAVHEISKQIYRHPVSTEMKKSNPMRKLNKNGFSLKALRSDKDDLVACYLDSNFAACLNMLHKYSVNSSGKELTEEMKGEMFRNLVLANANRGGENVNSGSVMGALMGGYVGYSALPQDLVDGLHAKFPDEKKEFEKIVDTFVEASQFTSSL